VLIVAVSSLLWKLAVNRQRFQDLVCTIPVSARSSCSRLQYD
jgi:hypothetical protein